MTDKMQEFISLSRTQGRTISSEQFIADNNELIQSIINKTFHRLRADSNVSLERLMQDLRTDDQIRVKINNANQAYSIVRSDYEKILTQRSTESWADTREYIKVFIFRMLTTIGIAAVVLVTGYLAHKWNIPIPLLRLAP